MKYRLYKIDPYVERTWSGYTFWLVVYTNDIMKIYTWSPAKPNYMRDRSLDKKLKVPQYLKLQIGKYLAKNSNEFGVNDIALSKMEKEKHPKNIYQLGIALILGEK